LNPGWTTSDFNRNAKEYARDMGMWYLNGLGLAQLAFKTGMEINPNAPH
jgi:hypothetical protein